MKTILLFLSIAFVLSGCYSGVGLGVGTSIGNHSGVGTNVHVGSDGQVHGSLGVGVGGSL